MPVFCFFNYLFFLSGWYLLRHPEPHRHGQTPSLSEVMPKEKKGCENNVSPGAHVRVCTRSCSDPGAVHFWNQIPICGFQGRTAQPPRVHPLHDAELKLRARSLCPAAAAFGVKAHQNDAIGLGPWTPSGKGGRDSGGSGTLLGQG